MKKEDKDKIKEIYKDAIGTWTLDLNDGYITEYGTTYIRNRTKKECIYELQFVLKI